MGEASWEAYAHAANAATMVERLSVATIVEKLDLRGVSSGKLEPSTVLCGGVLCACSRCDPDQNVPPLRILNVQEKWM